jgi:2,4-dienoyl-CoA reductase-like NADH-dependent reductase (Old Yellow Enzyme family)
MGVWGNEFAPVTDQASQHQGSSPEVLQPLPLGAKTLPNRIVFGAHLTNFGKGQSFSERHRAYYRARAAGGAGMIVTEALTVHPLDYPYEHVPFGHREEIVPSLAGLAKTLREARPEGPPLVLAQLNHTGGQCDGRLLRQSPWGPSAVPDVASRRVARAMLPDEIEEVIAGFAAAAHHVALAGLDGVEINAGQHALLRQFLSALTNLRDDEWGGSLENRMRMLTRVAAAVRERLGPEPVLGIKLCGDELAPWGGLTPQDAGEIAARLATAGAADYLSIQIAGPYAIHLTDAGMPTPEGHGLAQAAAVREAVAGRLPILAEGRIELRETARKALAEGQADALVMTRALISDPDLPDKWAGQRGEPVRPHVGMMRYFSVRGDWNRPLGDLINPRAGREALLPPVVPLEGAGAALVIGGGPAGLEAACTLARQGRPVRLLEAGGELGGVARRLATSIPARGEFARLVTYYRDMAERLGVQVELNRRVEGYERWMEDCEAIYLATGGQSPAPPIARKRGVAVLPARDLIVAPPKRLPGPEGGRAVVVDNEYGFRMAAAVEWLLERGYEVDVVSDDFYVGRGLVESGELLWFNRVAERGAVFHPRTVARSAEKKALTCADRFSGKEWELKPVALVVNAQPDVPADALWKPLREAHPRVIRVGDARAPRLMGEAILNAHRAVLLE